MAGPTDITIIAGKLFEGVEAKSVLAKAGKLHLKDVFVEVKNVRTTGKTPELSDLISEIGDLASKVEKGTTTRDAVRNTAGLGRVIEQSEQFGELRLKDRIKLRIANATLVYGGHGKLEGHSKPAIYVAEFFRTLSRPLILLFGSSYTTKLIKDFGNAKNDQEIKQLAGELGKKLKALPDKDKKSIEKLIEAVNKLAETGSSDILKKAADDADKLKPKEKEKVLPRPGEASTSAKPPTSIPPQHGTVELIKAIPTTTFAEHFDPDFTNVADFELAFSSLVGDQKARFAGLFIEEMKKVANKTAEQKTEYARQFATAYAESCAEGEYSDRHVQEYLEKLLDSVPREQWAGEMRRILELSRHEKIEEAVLSVTEQASTKELVREFNQFSVGKMLGKEEAGRRTAFLEKVRGIGTNADRLEGYLSSDIEPQFKAELYNKDATKSYELLFLTLRLSKALKDAPPERKARVIKLFADYVNSLDSEIQKHIKEQLQDVVVSGYPAIKEIRKALGIITPRAKV